MAREIKFRAWYSRSQSFVYFNLREGFTKEGIEIYRELLIQGEEFQQFTGLLDKNRKEIYEGDRLKYSFLKVNTSQVLEDNGFITVESIFQFDVMEAIKKADVIEVTGNIYEAPNS